MEDATKKRKRSEDDEGDVPLTVEITHRVRADGKKFVGKNSLTESALIAAKEAARSKQAVTVEEKKEQRRAANRLSAFQSRQRRRVIIEDLQQTVATITKQNEEARKTNTHLSAENAALREEVKNLKKLLAVRADQADVSSPSPSPASAPPVAAPGKAPVAPPAPVAAAAVLPAQPALTVSNMQLLQNLIAAQQQTQVAYAMPQSNANAPILAILSQLASIQGQMSNSSS